MKKKKRRKKRGKKVSLPNNVDPIIVVPHENESKIVMENDALDDDFVMFVLSILLMMRVIMLMI